MFSNRSEVNLVKRKVNGKTVYYYVFYDDDGVRRYRSTGQKTKAAAWDYVMKRRDQGLLRFIDKSCIPFGEYAEPFFDYERCPIVRDKLARGKSAARSTAYNRRIMFMGHVMPYFGKMALSSITPAKVNSWLLALPEKDKLSQSSSNNCFNLLRLVMAQAVKDGILSRNPCDNIERLGDDSEACESFTMEEVWKIIGEPEDWINPMHRVMCLTAALTGMRIAEVYALQPEDVFPDRIVIAWSYNDKDKRKTPKNGEKRIAPITEDLYRQIMEFSHGPGKYIFSTGDGSKPMTYTCIYIAFNKRLEKLGITDKTFHSFRAFVDTTLSMENINESVIQKMIGHKDRKMTEHYLHLESGDLRLIRDVQQKIEKGMA